MTNASANHPHPMTRISFNEHRPAPKDSATYKRRTEFDAEGMATIERQSRNTMKRMRRARGGKRTRTARRGATLRRCCSAPPMVGVTSMYRQRDNDRLEVGTVLVSIEHGTRRP